MTVVMDGDKLYRWNIPISYGIYITCGIEFLHLLGQKFMELMDHIKTSELFHMHYQPQFVYFIYLIIDPRNLDFH